MSPATLCANSTESGHQKAFFAWLAMATLCGVRAAEDDKSYTEKGYALATYGEAAGVPEFDWFYATPNGGKRDAATAARMKAEGARPGVWDTHLPIPSPGGTYRDLWIEFKRPKSEGKAVGRLSADQAKFGALMERFASRCAVCYTWREAVEVVLDYIAK